MKLPREHRVALSARALEIVSDCWPSSGKGFIFPGRGTSDGKNRPTLSSAAMLELLKDTRPGLTVHGFRSSFKDWATERTNFPPLLAEIALAHKAGDDTELAYRRGDVLEKRRQLMEAWARFCTRALAPGGVVPLRVMG
jgi:integrase